MIVVPSIKEQLEVLSDYRNLTRLKQGNAGLQKADFNAFVNAQYTYSRNPNKTYELDSLDYQAILKSAIIYALKDDAVNHHQKDLIGYSVDLLRQSNIELNSDIIVNLFINSIGLLTAALDSLLLASEQTRSQVITKYEQKPVNGKINWINNVEQILNQRNNQR